MSNNLPPTISVGDKVAPNDKEPTVTEESIVTSTLELIVTDAPLELGTTAGLQLLAMFQLPIGRKISRNVV